ncbi:hypothetical protein IJI31_03525 [bacterium]|nr:hypothetical protein [bacterium]
MKISAVDNTNFGMAVKVTPQAREYLLNNLTKKQLKKVKDLAKFAEKDSVDVNISTEKMRYRTNIPELETTQLVIDVDNGAKTYKPDLFIVRAIKKAVNYAHELSKKRKILGDIL